MVDWVYRPSGKETGYNSSTEELSDRDIETLAEALHKHRGLP